MSNEVESKERLEETREYLEEHKILELFNNLTSQMIFARPAEPKRFMIETLEKLNKSRTTKRDFPCLFDDSNIQSVYGMLDPTNRGYITLRQYTEALTTLGISNFNETPDGTADDRITFETFLNEADKVCLKGCSVSGTLQQNNPGEMVSQEFQLHLMKKASD